MVVEIYDRSGQPIWELLMDAQAVATREAHKSPCVRRKYGAILFGQTYIVDMGDMPWNHMEAHNNRVSRCCNHGCIRDLMSVRHGHNTDLGAEVHAEQSLLVREGTKGWSNFLIVGFDKHDKPFYDRECWPCYSCARIVKEKGIKTVWVPLKENGFKNYLIEDILEAYEQEMIQSLGDL